MTSPNDVVSFWVDEVGPQGWYCQDAELDAKICERFKATWEVAATADCEGKVLDKWFETPGAMLGLLIMLDQFSRNMFRGDQRAFAADKRARAIAKQAIDKGWDMRVPTPQRQFFYLPLMHTECLMDQDRAIRMMKTRMGSESNLLHAKVHREIIRRFGRFPCRNQVMARATTVAEASFLEKGGYGAVLHEFQEAA